MKRHLSVLLASSLIAAACTAGGPASGSGADIIDDDFAAEETQTDEPASEPEPEPESEPASDPEPDSDSDSDSEPAPDPEPDSEPEASPAGTRDNPLPLGTRIEIADWELTVVEVNPDAETPIMAENQFNDPPEDGQKFVMWTVEATYNGNESGDAGWDFRWKILGGAGNTFDDSCGVIPSPLRDTGETFPGGSVSGNICVSVESDQFDGATIMLEELLSFDDTRVFYATS